MKNESVGSHLLLTGYILFAQIDFNGMLDYALKALVGGGIWLGYSYLNERMKKKQTKNEP